MLIQRSTAIYIKLKDEFFEEDSGGPFWRSPWGSRNLQRFDERAVPLFAGNGLPCLRPDPGTWRFTRWTPVRGFSLSCSSMSAHQDAHGFKVCFFGDFWSLCWLLSCYFSLFPWPWQSKDTQNSTNSKPNVLRDARQMATPDDFTSKSITSKGGIYIYTIASHDGILIGFLTFTPWKSYRKHQQCQAMSTAGWFEFFSRAVAIHNTSITSMKGHKPQSYRYGMYGLYLIIQVPASNWRFFVMQRHSESDINIHPLQLPSNTADPNDLTGHGRSYLGCLYLHLLKTFVNIFKSIDLDL